MFREYSSALNGALHAADTLAIAISAWFAHYVYLGDAWMSEQYFVVVFVALLLSALLFGKFSLYQAWRGASLIDEVQRVGMAWGTVLLGLTALAFTTKTGATFSRGWLLSWAALGWFFLVGGRVLLRLFLRLARSQGFNQRHVVIVGSPDSGAQIVERFKKAPWMGLNVIGFFHSGGKVERAISGVDSLGGLEDIASFVQQGNVDQVWIAMPLSDADRVQWLLNDLRHATVDIRFVPDLFGMRLLNHSMMDVAGLPVINLSVSPMSGMNALVKAVEDRVLALLILILISPIMALVALGVKLTSPGPVFYRQERMGWNGHTFNMLKFRSMPVDTESAGVTWGRAEEKTSHWFGAFIRKTSLDELPQFLNVLKGEMSIVGPRPERTIFVEEFKEEIPNYMKKHLVKAGITGWAQVNGWRGDTDLRKRIEYDIYYIENWSIWFDLKIISLTLVKVFVGKNAS